MSEGSIFYACRGDSYVLKFIGDVRLTLCSTLDQHLQVIFCNKGFTRVLIDLTETESIDSTSLGLIAKLAKRCKEKSLEMPTIVSTNDDVTRILTTMGFDQVFLLLDQLPTNATDLERLPQVQESEEEVRLRIIDAHKVLMDLNDANRDAFKDLVKTLECC